MEISLKGLLGLRGSLADRGDNISLIKTSPSDAASFSCFFTVFLETPGELALRFVIDFGESKGEGSFLDLDLGEAAVEELF